MVSVYPSPPSHRGLVIVTSRNRPCSLGDLCRSRHRVMQSFLNPAPDGSVVDMLPFMRPIVHYDTATDCVVPLPKAILCEQFNAFARFDEAQTMTNKAILAQLRMVNADQIHHQLRNVNDSRINRAFDALITLLEENASVIHILRQFFDIRLLIRTRHRFETRMHRYYSTLPFGARLPFERRHAIRRFAQNGRMRLYTRYIYDLVLGLVAMRKHQRLSVSSVENYDENAIPRSLMERTGQSSGPVGGKAEEEVAVKVEEL